MILRTQPMYQVFDALRVFLQENKAEELYRVEFATFRSRFFLYMPIELTQRKIPNQVKKQLVERMLAEYKKNPLSASDINLRIIPPAGTYGREVRLRFLSLLEEASAMNNEEKAVAFLIRKFVPQTFTDKKKVDKWIVLKILKRILKSILRRLACLDSLIDAALKTQTELICVDDKSTDSSLAILEEYAAAYPAVVRIVRHEENRGVAAARNSGLKIARAEYLAFIDGDDLVVPHYLDVSLGIVEKYQPDMVLFSFSSFDNVRGCDEHGGLLWPHVNFTNEYGNFSLEGLVTKSEDLRKLVFLDSQHIWVRIFHRKLFFDHDIFFPEGFINFQDGATVPRLSFFAKSIYVMNHYMPILYRTNVPTSLSFQGFDTIRRRTHFTYQAFDLLQTFLQENKAEELYRVEFATFRSRYFLYMPLELARRKIPNQVKKQLVERMLAEYKKNPLSASDINLETIPPRETYGREVRLRFLSLLEEASAMNNEEKAVAFLIRKFVPQTFTDKKKVDKWIVLKILKRIFKSILRRLDRERHRGEILMSSKLSIVIPVYNIEKYIKACLDSLIHAALKTQTELICVDDKSTDSSLAILEEYAAAYPTVVRIVRHEQNRGLSAARNSGLKIARAEYLAFIDGDDLVAPHYLEVSLGILEKYQPDMVLFSFAAFDNEGGCNKNGGLLWPRINFTNHYGNFSLEGLVTKNRERHRGEILMSSKLSIIIPVYNIEKYIKACLDSLIHAAEETQTELICVDDKSTDSSLAILEEYAAAYPAVVRIVRHEQNRGLSAARNSGLKIARAEYLAFIDGDDLVAPHYLE
ncbi:unnamed protein product, partial [Darwinula stevensoni]